MEERIQTLLLGQAEVDRKRSEVRQIVAMVLGKLGPVTKSLEKALPPLIEGWDEENRVLWEISCYELGVLHVQAHSGHLVFSTSHLGKVFFELDSVLRVRRSLGFFLQQVSSKFPELDELLQLYIDAAKEEGH